MAIEIKVPAVGESVQEVTIGSWLKNEGDYVEMDEVICELESEKATVELNAEKAGVLHILVKEGETIAIGTVVCSIDETTEPVKNQDEKPKEAQTSESTEVKPDKQENNQESKSYATGHPSPSAKKILDEKGISTDNVKGTGKDGRITKEDALKVESTRTVEKAPTSDKKEEILSSKGSRDTETKRLSSLRKTIAKRLVQVKNETAMLTTFQELDVSAIKEIRSQYQDSFVKRYGIKLGFMSFFVKACSTALMEFPSVNAMINENDVIYHQYVDTSIAVSTPKGLVTPVLKNTELMSFAEIEQRINDLGVKAREGKITIDEMTGGTFTITNGGIFGSMLSTPIINPPQSAILGMHNITERPVAIKGSVEIRPIMYLALSYDHRIIDGRDSVSFLFRVKELLEDPARLLIEA